MARPELVAVTTDVGRRRGRELRVELRDLGLLARVEHARDLLLLEGGRAIGAVGAEVPDRVAAPVGGPVVGQGRDGEQECRSDSGGDE